MNKIAVCPLLWGCIVDFLKIAVLSRSILPDSGGVKGPIFRRFENAVSI
tara:strand:- start:2267 stop:2413 length:147 start_codon:yes stop_codon:yes gene_type:complete